MESTGIEIHDDGFSEFADDVQGDVRSSTSSSRDYGSCRYGIPPKRPSSNYTAYSDLNSREITGWPTSIVFRGLKNSSAKRSMTTATCPVEEPTVYGTLFEQADPWDTIGQILGLPNTNPSKNPGEINELIKIDQREASSETSSAVVETEEREEDLMSADDIPELQYPLLIERQLTGLQVSSSSRCESQKLGRQEDAENAGTHQSPQEIAQVSETGLSGEIEDGKEYESALAIPELEELDGLFLGPSLFELDKDEDEI